MSWLIKQYPYGDHRSSKKYCTKCGARLKPSYVFCGSCGARVDDD